jgi:hypothetical protein
MSDLKVRVLILVEEIKEMEERERVQIGQVKENEEKKCF